MPNDRPADVYSISLGNSPTSIRRASATRRRWDRHHALGSLDARQNPSRRGVAMRVAWTAVCAARTPGGMGRRGRCPSSVRGVMASLRVSGVGHLVVQRPSDSGVALAKERLTMKDHFVPQVYLRGFTDGSTEPELYFYRKKDGCCKKRSTKSVAFEYDLEAMPAHLVGEENRSIISDLLKDVDDDFFDLRERLNDLAAKRGSIDDDLKIKVSDHMGFQTVRTRTFLDFMIGGHEERSARGIIPLPTSNGKLSEDQKKRLYLSFMIQLDDTSTLCWTAAQSYHSMAWNLAINRTQQPFFTSDTPVLMLTGVPYASTDSTDDFVCHHAFPVTSELMIMVGHRPHGDEGPISFVECDGEMVNFWNNIQVAQCHRCVYSRENPKEVCDAICDAHPELRLSDLPTKAGAALNDNKLSLDLAAKWREGHGGSG